MAIDLHLERSASAILDVLLEVSPAEAAQFQDEFRDALQRASAALDLVPADRVVNR